jgi:hypothetical protein
MPITSATTRPAADHAQTSTLPPLKPSCRTPGLIGSPFCHDGPSLSIADRMAIERKYPFARAGSFQTVIHGVRYTTLVTAVGVKALKDGGPYLDAKGRAECFELIKAASSKGVPTTEYRAGPLVSHATSVGTLLAKQFRADGKLPAYGVGARHGAVLAEPVRPERIVVLDQYANGSVNGVEVWNHISIRPLQVMGGAPWQSDVNKGDGLREILFPY